MPKNQPTAGKKARAAARTGAKYTAFLRAQQAAVDEARELVVAGLSEVIAQGGTVPVRVVWLDEPRLEQHRGDRWGVVEPAVDGVVIREVPAPAGAVEKGTRVPVPHRLPDGRVEVADLWPVVWQSNDEPFWRYVHNGWSCEKPGDYPDGLDPMCPSPELPYEVRVYDVPDGIVGEDHWGSAPSWWTKAWCTGINNARELADAMVAHRLRVPERPAGGDCGYLRAEVWEHVTRDLSVLPHRVYQVDADPDRPVAPHLPFGTWPAGRPESAQHTPEPVWHAGEKHPPNYQLRVWSEEGGWTSLAWIDGGRTPASIAATLLRVGTGGSYSFAETWGPRHPDAWAHDWTQEGRCLADYHPDMPHAEHSARLAVHRQAEENRLAAALAERSRGALTMQQAVARIQTGGQKYRDFLSTGSAAISRALHTARRAAKGVDRLRMREALDALERHEVADWVVELTHTYLSTSPGDGSTPQEQAYVRRALEEYLTPGPRTNGVPGLSGT
ncbi:hypothetical protein AB0H07_46465 [Streptomyces sp. NPDC021354]|uniref:hypothetical protein n=1 Tax=Streptomyces sp. NPDC021354 TaxID=3154793 RepID=UPI0033D7411E